jgi:2-polyprenyl-3-methyl-5-hydroxy-6-metoxy-1,4-benzoquinol methylase
MMIKKFLLDILVDPISKKPLQFFENTNTVSDNSISSYAVIEAVPIILSSDEDDIGSKSIVHTQYGTKFNYKAHYKIDAEFNDYFEEESATTLKERERSRQAIISKVPNSSKLILDVGCGGGWVANYFTKKNKQVISMDIAPKNPAEALKKNPSEYHAALVADVLSLPIKDNSVDVIIASEVIEHVADPKKFIEKLLAATKQGGKIILVTPYNEKIIYHTCVHCNNPTPSNAHLYFFNEQNIKDYLPAVGIKYDTMCFSNKYFTKLRIYNILSFLPFVIWLGLDNALNKLIPKPSIFLIEITKNVE